MLTPPTRPGYELDPEYDRQIPWEEWRDGERGGWVFYGLRLEDMLENGARAAGQAFAGCRDVEAQDDREVRLGPCPDLRTLVEEWWSLVQGWARDERWIVASCDLKVDEQVFTCEGTVSGEPFDMAQHRPPREWRAPDAEVKKVYKGVAGWEVTLESRR